MQNLFRSVLIVGLLITGACRAEAPQKMLTITWGKSTADTKTLVKKLKATGKTWNKVVGIARGGVVPAAIVAYELGIRHFDTISINSYDDSTKTQSEPEVLKGMQSNDDGILVIDDIVNTGKTLKLVRNATQCIHSHSLCQTSW